MTQQDDITQRVLTDDEINDLCGWRASNTTMRAENDRALAREVESALLSKLRAPVAVPPGWKLVPVEPTPEMEDAGCDVPCPQDDAPAPATVYAAMIGAAPPAPEVSAPVADERAAFYINPSVIDQKTGRIGEHVKTALTWSNTKHHGWQVPVFLSPPLASAPVAGEAQGWSGWACQYPNKLPRLYGSKEIAQLNCDAANGDRVLFLSEHAAPQASAEALEVARAALMEIADLADVEADQRGVIVNQALTKIAKMTAAPQADKDGCTCPSGDGSLRHPCPMHPGADKDGGQQRAGDVVERAVLDVVRAALPEFRQQDDYLLAHGASLMSEDSHEIIHIDTLRRVISAALSAPQAEQEERDAQD